MGGSKDTVEAEWITTSNGSVMPASADRSPSRTAVRSAKTRFASSSPTLSRQVRKAGLRSS